MDQLEHHDLFEEYFSNPKVPILSSVLTWEDFTFCSWENFECMKEQLICEYSLED